MPRGRAPYLERFIHGALYEARPDVISVVHNHSESVIPFGVTGKKIKPIFHMGASIGHEVPVWDSHDHFGDTALLVENMDMGRDLAKLMGAGGTALMRGHGATVAGKNIRHAVYISVYLEVNARLQKQAMDMGEVKFLTAGRGGQGRRAHRLLRHQPGLGELVPARRPAFPGGAELTRHRIAPRFSNRQRVPRHTWRCLAMPDRPATLFRRVCSCLHWSGCAIGVGSDGLTAPRKTDGRRGDD